MKFDIDYIEHLISIGAEESLTLEFKSSGSLDFSDNKKSEANKTELSRDVSAMANSEGGLIIYGVREKDHVAKSITYIDGNIITKERIEQIIQNRIKRQIPEVIIHPIRKDQNIEQSIYVLEIRQSEDSPHMAYDGSYYKRNNFNRIQYMEYEVRREYNRIRKSKLSIEHPIINSTDGKFLKKGQSETGHFRVWFHIKNIGRILDKEFKQEIMIPNEIHNSYYLEPNPIQKYSTHTLPTHQKFSIPNKATIFPNETIRLCSTYIYVKEEHFNKEIKMKLYYTGGIEELNFTIRQMFDNQYEKEEEYNFELKYQKKE